jgi:hypothetical protein
MKTFLLERTIPLAFRWQDPAVLAEHCRWAADAYGKVGAMWLGGVITDAGMFSLVTAESEAVIRNYWRSLDVTEDQARLRTVLGTVGPFHAAEIAAPAR